MVVFLRPGHPELVTSKTPAVTRTRGQAFRWSLGMPWSQHWYQAWPMGRGVGRGVRNYPASPYPRPSARVIMEASRVRVSGLGLGFVARLCHALVRTALAGTGAYTLTMPNRGVRVVVFLRPGHPKLVTWVVRRRVLDVAIRE